MRSSPADTPPINLRERVARLRERAEGLLEIVGAERAEGLLGVSARPGEA